MKSLDAQLEIIRNDIQHNCAISDARHARDYSLCIYLLRMREYYRWQQNLPLGEPINKEALGSWVIETEQWWDTIEETDFKVITITGRQYDPFDVRAINDALAPTNVVYSAGLGRLGQPHFMLAELCDHPIARPAITTCVECDTELARDLITLPAMTQNSTIYLRHDSIVRMLWQMVDEWNVRRQPGPMARVVQHYKLDGSNTLSDSLKRAATDLSNLLYHHELGEIEVAKQLDNKRSTDEFSDMTQLFQGSHSEAWLRAARDLYADTLQTWPFIVKQQSIHHLDFWLAGLIGLREEFAKQTGIHDHLLNGSDKKRLHALENLIEPEQTRWHKTTTRLLEQYRQHKNQFDVTDTIKRNLHPTKP